MAEVMFVNRQECALAFGVSEPTIDRWITAGMPVAQAGSNGRSYQIDLAAAQRWRADQDQEAEQAEAEKAARLREFQQSLDLQGGSAQGHDALAFKARADYYAAELQRIKLARQRGDLVEVAAVVRVNTKVLTFLADRLQSLPDYLERACGLAPEVVSEISIAVDDWQAALADDLAKNIHSDD